MKIHEYQAKELFRKHGIPVPQGTACFSAAEVVEAAKQIPGSVKVVKAQIHAGGRGKGGGVKVAKTPQEVEQFANDIFGMQLKTHQTGPEGQQVRRLLVEEGANIKAEYYVAITLDRARSQLCLMVSPEGGMDIEEVADKNPEKIFKEWINPSLGLRDFQARALCSKMAFNKTISKQFVRVLNQLIEVFETYDCSIVEVNPLIETADEKVIALDAKVNFDDNALYRHPNINELQDEDEEDPAELKANAFDLSYVSLDGNIGCMVNGAGLAMGTMDIIKLEGGEPANFLDVGGSATAEKVTEAFKIILEDEKVNAILVNIFGGIMKCDVIAEGVISAAKQLDLKIPLVVRLEGTNVEAGKKMLAESGLKIEAATGMKEAAQKAVKAAAGA